MIICWKDNTAGHKQCSTFLDSIDESFLTRLTEEPIKTDALMDLILTNKEELIGEVKAEGSLGCSDHESTSPDFRRADFGLFRCLLGRILWDKVLKGRQVAIEERIRQLHEAHRDFGPTSQHFLTSYKLLLHGYINTRLLNLRT
ncbi:glycerol kinase [Limosa lapponica baueri]|uniref:Glycerol kinase n=1 Tax=Limosa lapponica baueri TaxID=1758121 RepID=A0A2I0TNS5_LIMLA|nr:glycerol kinase [Limosa lapponica baueri]